MEAVNRQNLSLLDELVVQEYMNPQLKIQSLEDLKQVLRRQYKGFTDVHRFRFMVGRKAETELLD
jgi:hypothetical protein